MTEQEDVPYESLSAATERTSHQNACARTNDIGNIFQLENGQDGPPSVNEGTLSKQTSLLHQSSSYLKQATSGFMRWQSRRAFWSAQDQVGDQPRGVGFALTDTRSAMAHWLKTVLVVSRRHPTVLILPLLLLCACIAGGIVGVVLAANQSAQRSQDDIATVARQAASTLELLVDAKNLQPLLAAASLVRQQPAMSVLGPAAPELLKSLLPASLETPVRQLVLAPFGVVNMSYSLPLDGAAPDGGGGARIFSVGDFVWSPSWLGATTAVTAAMAVAVDRKMPAVAGVSVSATGGPAASLLITFHPVYAAAADPQETWGNRLTADFTERLCGEDSCFDSRTGTKLWGFVVAVSSLQTLVANSNSGFQLLPGGDYMYRLTFQPTGSTAWTSLLVSSPPPQERHRTVAVPVRLEGPRAGSAVAVGTGAEILVDHDSAWRVTWEGPLIAVVVVVSLALSGFLFAMLFNYWRHLSMVKAMLPEKVIRVLETGSNFYQNFDSVTVLYADVVRYTTAKHQQGDAVPTLEVVKLLNDVHSMHESIIEKHGVVRIRRSGESFLCVGGCPTPEDPVAAALRVAACARDLVLATSRFRGIGGFRVQIRVGLHSGPAVAAVVGSKTPRFSLFGDVVDVAYYMEATSRVMAVHVSDVTSKLLMSANDPFLQLTPRGRLDILGQGSMQTSWLRLDQLPDPGSTTAASASGQDDTSATAAGEAGRKEPLRGGVTGGGRTGMADGILRTLGASGGGAGTAAGMAVGGDGDGAGRAPQNLELVGLIGSGGGRVSSSGGVVKAGNGGSGGGAPPGGGVAR